jgi:hypothetical protein
MRLQSRTKERIEKKRLLSNGSLLWWGTVLLDCFFPLSAMALGVFLWRRGMTGCEMMEVYASGFA